MDNSPQRNHDIGDQDGNNDRPPKANAAAAADAAADGNLDVLKEHFEHPAPHPVHEPQDEDVNAGGGYAEDQGAGVAAEQQLDNNMVPGVDQFDAFGDLDVDAALEGVDLEDLVAAVLPHPPQVLHQPGQPDVLVIGQKIFNCPRSIILAGAFGQQHQPQPLREVAIKRIFVHPEWRQGGDDAMTEFGWTEARLLQHLVHPNIIQYVDVPKNLLADHDIVMEQGTITLDHYIERFKNHELMYEGAPMEDHMYYMFSQQFMIGAVSGLAHVHAGGFVINHLDLSKVILCFDGCPKVFDMGEAGLAEQPRKGVPPGLDGYLAPDEQAYKDNYAPGDHYVLHKAADIHCFGVMMYWLLFDHMPWDKASPEDPGYSAFLNNHFYWAQPLTLLSRGLHEIMIKMLHPSPNFRCTALEIENALQQPWFAHEEEALAYEEVAAPQQPFLQ
eukprot:m.71641 g.71641  ORF g.71641 m.71641 type:complete len:443 (-) comp8727_c0_seq1:191-1519(-)